MSLCLENLAIRKTNGDALFSAFNMTVEKGEIVTLMGGPSGCGKSTLLDAIAGHYPPSSTTLDPLRLITKSWMPSLP